MWTPHALSTHFTEFCPTCRSISCSRYSIARSTYSFLLENVSGMLFPPGMMGTILPSALCPTKESRGIIWKTCDRESGTVDHIKLPNRQILLEIILQR